MSVLDNIIAANQRQLTLDDILTWDDSPQIGIAADMITNDHDQQEVPISPENGTNPHFEPGASVGHSDYSDFRAVYVGPGRRPGQALVRIVAGWSDTPPAWPVTVPYSKLEVL